MNPANRKRKGEGKKNLEEALSLGLNPFQASEKYGMTLRSVYALASKYKIRLPRKKKDPGVSAQDEPAS